MMRAVWLSLPLLAAHAVLFGGGLVHGLWTDRWAYSDAVADAMGRLGRVPLTVGDWEGRALQLDPQDLALAGGAGYVSRGYVNRLSGERLNLLILTGLPGPLSVHTPDVCYRGLGYEPSGEVQRWEAPTGVPGRTAEFYTAVFTKQGGAAPPLRILWAWGAAGSWQAPDNPRLALASQGAAFKLYLIQPMGSDRERLEEGPCPDFIRRVFPELQRCLFEKGEAAPGQPPTPKG
jgi:hypothetical protein